MRTAKERTARKVSTHAPARGQSCAALILSLIAPLFQLMPPRGGNPKLKAAGFDAFVFQLMPPRGGNHLLLK